MLGVVAADFVEERRQVGAAKAHDAGIAEPDAALGRIGVEIFVAHAHRRAKARARAELAAGLVDRGDLHRHPDPVHILIDVAAVGGGEILLLVDQEQRGVDEVGAGGHRGGVGRQQQIDLFLDRHFHRVLLDRGLPAHLAHALDRCQLHRLGLDGGIGLGDGHGLRCGGSDGVRRERVGRGKAPGAVGNDPHTGTDRFGVDDVLDSVFAGDNELVQIASDAHIAVARAGRRGGGQCAIGQCLLDRDIDAPIGQRFGGNQTTGERNHQPGGGQAGDGKEIASVHCDTPMGGEQPGSSVARRP